MENAGCQESNPRPGPYVIVVDGKRRIFSPVWPIVNTFPAVTENASFRQRSPEWRVLKTPFCCTRRKRRFWKTITSRYWIPVNQRCYRFQSLERLRFTFTPNGRREFVLYHVTKFPPYFPFTLYCFHKKISSFMSVLTIGIVRDCFYLLIFYSEKFST